MIPLTMQVAGVEGCGSCSLEAERRTSWPLSAVRAWPFGSALRSWSRDQRIREENEEDRRALLSKKDASSQPTLSTGIQRGKKGQPWSDDWTLAKAANPGSSPT